MTQTLHVAGKPPLVMKHCARFPDSGNPWVCNAWYRGGPHLKGFLHSASSSLWVWASGKEELTGLAMWIGAGYIRRLWMEALVGRGELILDPHLGISSSTYSGHSSEERLTESMQRSYRPSHKHQQNQNGSLLSMRSLATDA